MNRLYRALSAAALILAFSSVNALDLPPPIPTPSQGLQTYGAGLPLGEFLRITLGEMSHRAYVLAPDVNAASLISADLSRSKARDPLPVVRELLSAMGLSIREVGGVLLIEKSRPAPEREKPQPTEVRVYQPKYRSVSSLSTYFGLYPDVTFTFNAGLAVPAPAATSTSPENSPAGSGSGQPVRQTYSTGATAFSATDKDPSFLVMRGHPDKLSEVEQLLSKIDVPLTEVLITAYVYEVRDATSRDSAVNLVLSLLGDRLRINTGATIAAPNVSLGVSSLSVAVSALQSDSRVKLVSSPVLRAADGATASASIGTDTPTLGAIVSQNGSTSQSVSYQSAGVLLSVSPRVFSDSIRLNISQELSSFVRTDTGLSSTPTKLRRAFRTDVITRDGETVLLGGLTENSASKASGKTFGLFSSSSKNEAQSELVVLLQVQRL